jgi:tetratricopeptide (TPR) repeat protein
MQRFDEAAALIEPVAAVREKTLGRSHETLWTTWVWLARTQQRRGRLEEARAVFLKARDTAAEVMGPDDPNALPYVQVYGMFLHQTGDLDAALALRTELLAQSHRTFPDGHVNIAKYAWDLGETLAARQADDAYAALCDEWLAQWVSLFGEQDSRVVDARRWLAEAQRRRAGGTTEDAADE